MKTYEAVLESISPILYSRPYEHEVPALSKEGKDDYERRTWRNRVHVNEQGKPVIPAIAFRNSLREVAAYLGMQIPGKGKSTYTKHFQSGVLIIEAMVLNGIETGKIPSLAMFVPADGKHGGGKRVWKFFPKVDKWQGTIRVTVIDETITYDVLLLHLTEAGKYKGVLSRRPGSGGEFGRYKVVSLVEVKE